VRGADLTAYGELLHVDLSSGRTWTEPAEAYRDYIGARGLNSHLLYKLVKPGIDPLSPENVLIFGTGPIAGTLAPAASRYTVTAKSPLTGIFGDSNSGGHWSAELKYAGYDGIIFYGRSPKPVYLLVADDRVSLLDAGDLWGRDTWQTEEALKCRHRDMRLSVACIGIAGENLVKFACIINDFTRAAGRTGMGAVMGSKNLKAIAVRGTRGVSVAQPKRYFAVCGDLKQRIRDSRQFELYGLSGTLRHRGLEDFREDDPGPGLGGYKYQSTNVSQGFFRIGGKEWWRTYWTKRKACSACQMHCSHFYTVRDGPMAGIMSEGIDVEAMCWLSVHVGAERKDAVAYAYQLANRLGLDTNEIGACIGGLMLLYERGLIGNEDMKKLGARWLRPNWGDQETILTLMELTARRQGIGALVAEGPAVIAEKIGGEAGYWFILNKGMNVGGADRRPQKGGLLNVMVSTRGPDHLRGSPSLEFYGYTGDKKIKEDWDRYIGEPELFEHAATLGSYKGKPPLVIWQEHLRALSDSFGVCSFNYGNWPNSPIGPEDFAELYSAATGLERSPEDMLRAAARIVNVEKAFNVREGWRREDDAPPERWVKEPQPNSGTKGEHVHPEEFQQMLDEYYTRRGWDRETGLPRRETLETLGLDYVADELAAMGRLAQK